MTKITVVIVNYNTRDLLRSCLNSLQTEEPDEIILVDNASTDGSAEMINADFPSVRLIRHERNMGYGVSANHAVAQCQTPYFLLLNTERFDGDQPSELNLRLDRIEKSWTIEIPEKKCG